MMREIRYGKRPYTNTWLTKGKKYTTGVPKLFLFLFYLNCVGCYQCKFIIK